MRGTIALVVLLAACGGDAPKRRVPGGNRASVPQLVKMLDAITLADAKVLLLAQGVSEVCGKACACLELEHAMNRASVLDGCRALWASARRPDAGADWVAAYTAGLYLADQHDASDARDRARLANAMTLLTLPIEPTGAALGVNVPPTQHVVDAPDGGPHLVVLDAQGNVRVGTGPTARLTPTGAVLEPAELKALGDTAALTAFLRSLDEPDLAPDDDDDDDDGPGPSNPGSTIPSGTGFGPGGAGATDDDARRQALEQARSAGILGTVAPDGAGWGGIRMGRGALGPPQSATGTSGRAARNAVVVVADRATPGPRLVEVLSLAGAAVLTADHGGGLVGFPLVFRGAQAGDLPGGGLYADLLGGGSEPVHELVIEVDATAFAIGNAAMGDFRRVDPTDRANPDGAPLVIKELLTSAAFIDRHDVIVSVRPEARAALVVQAVDAALQAGARTVRIEAWYDRKALAEAGGGLHDPSAPTVRIGQPLASGDLDKAIIRRYIKREVGKITFCYEKALLASPGLEGTVQTQFFIAPDGNVSAVSAKGVNDDVAACVAGVIKKIRFPQPKGGGGVQVSYPFTFRAAE